METRVKNKKNKKNNKNANFSEVKLISKEIHFL